MVSLGLHLVLLSRPKVETVIMQMDWTREINNQMPDSLFRELLLAQSNKLFVFQM